MLIITLSLVIKSTARIGFQQKFTESFGPHNCHKLLLFNKSQNKQPLILDHIIVINSTWWWSQQPFLTFLHMFHVLWRIFDVQVHTPSGYFMSPSPPCINYTLFSPIHSTNSRLPPPPIKKEEENPQLPSLSLKHQTWN